MQTQSTEPVTPPKEAYAVEDRVESETSATASPSGSEESITLVTPDPQEKAHPVLKKGDFPKPKRSGTFPNFDGNGDVPNEDYPYPEAPKTPPPARYSSFKGFNRGSTSPSTSPYKPLPLRSSTSTRKVEGTPPSPTGSAPNFSPKMDRPPSPSAPSPPRRAPQVFHLTSAQPLTHWNKNQPPPSPPSARRGAKGRPFNGLTPIGSGQKEDALSRQVFMKPAEPIKHISTVLIQPKPFQTTFHLDLTAQEFKAPSYSLGHDE